MTLRPLHCRLEEQCGYRVQIVGEGCEPKPRGFEGDAPASRGRIEDQGNIEGVSCGTHRPLPVVIARRVRKRTPVAIRVRAQIHLISLRRIELAPRRHRIPVNSEHVQEPLPVRIRRQQGGEYGRTRRHQRPSRPPDVEVVRRGQRRHGTALPDAFLPEHGNRQPPFDQPNVVHVLTRGRCGVSKTHGP